MRVILTVIPFIWMILLLPVVNRIEPTIDGIPMLAWWVQLGVVVTVICIRQLWKIDMAEEARQAAKNEERGN